MHLAKGDKKGCPRHDSNTSRQSPKATYMEHHPFPAAPSCLKGPHIHLSPGVLWVQDPCSRLSTQQAPGADTHPEHLWMFVLSKHFYCCSFHSPMGWDFSPGGAGCLPALPRKRSSTGESGMFQQPPLHQGGVQHLPHITAPSLPLLS